MIDSTLMQFSTDVVSSLFWFVAWSACLYLLCLLVSYKKDKWLRWSPFWLLLCLLAALPLLPVYPMDIQAKIPLVLLQAVEQGNTLMLNSQQLLVTSTSLTTSVWQWFCSYLLVHIILVSLLKTITLYKTLKQLKSLEVFAIPAEQLPCFSLEQLAKLKQYNIQVCQSDKPTSAFVFGWGKPILFLPNYISTLPLIQQQLLIEHELTHIQRKDHKVLLCLRLYRSLFWFNPFLGYFEQRFIQSMEMNCDSQVLRQYPGKVKEYARALVNNLKLSKVQPQTKQRALTAAFTQHKSNSVFWHQRLEQLALSQHPARQRYMKIALSSTCVFAAVFVLGVQASQQHSHFQASDTQQIALLPVADARITATFGISGKLWGNKKHKGIDMAAPVGTQVFASMSGTVLIADDSSLHKNYGKVILLQHQDQTQSLYAHLDSINVQPGQRVMAGEQIGKVGTTGRTTGPHLHFELLVAGKRVDPSHRLPL